ncbi:MAG: gliding motility-associated C-terminal domain-containing protein [Saprospiraceae bacterium]|nr:gliding motility-associated C-terminal domain-containing protein [Saprospiraceae bacterium]
MTRVLNYKSILSVVFLIYFLLGINKSIAQPCQCINCPGTIPKAGNQDFSTTEFLYFVNGAESNSLEDLFQGVCAVNVVFKADNVFQVEMYLISPGGDTVRLVGPDAGSGVGVTALTTWSVAFMPSSIAVFPDPGFSPVWTNYDPWETGANYTGTYYPNLGKLEDFDSGPVNGPWRLVVKNYAPLNKGEVIDFSIVFCDETGIECGCLAYAGIYPSFQIIEACQGSDKLKLNLNPNYNGYEPDPKVFNYTYTIASPKNVILEFTEAPDLSGYAVGNYKVCGLSYLQADSALVIKDAGITKLDTIYKEISSPDPDYCADLSKNCIFININPPPPPVNIEQFLCQDSCITFHGKTYCMPGSYTFTELDSLGCSINYNLKLNPATTKYYSYTDTICVGEFVIFGVDFYNKTGIYTKTFKSFTGCDSIVTLNLKVMNFDIKVKKPDTLNCVHEQVLLDGSDVNENNPSFSYLWTASGGGEVIGPGNMPDLWVSKPGTYKLTGTFTLSSGKTCTDFVNVTVAENIIQPELTTVPDQFLCLGDELDLSKLNIKEIHGMPGTLSYHSANPPDATNQISPLIQPTVSGVYYAHFVVGKCDAVKQINVNVNKKPKAEVKPLLNVCNSAMMGENTLVNFDTLIVSGDNKGYWTDKDFSGATGTFPLLDFTGVKPGTYEFVYTTQSAIPPCTDTFYIVNVIVEDCECPSLATLSPGDMCQNSAKSDLNALLITTESGNWSLESAPPGSTASINGSIFDGTGSTPGNYSIKFTLSQIPPQGCQESVVLNLKIVAPPELQMMSDITVCNSDDMGQGTTVDMLQTIVAGNKTGIWKDIDNSGAVGIFPVLDFKNIAPGIYRFRYETNSAEFPCPEVYDTVNVTVKDCNCPTVSLLSTVLCNIKDTLLLNDLVITGQAGTWQLLTSPSGANPAKIIADKFIFDNSNAGKYELKFVLSNPVAGCQSDFITTVELLQAPFTELDTVKNICNSNQNGHISLLDFSTLLKAGDLGGSWQQVVPSGATGTLPLLDFNGVAPGSYYFKYITNSAVSPCKETEYLIRIIVEDCSCPSVTTVNPGKFCNNNLSINLDNYKVTTEAGSWAIVMTPPGTNPATVVLNTFSGTNADPGIYTIQFNLQANPPFGCPTFSIQTIEVVADLTADIIQMVSVCNDGSAGNVSTVNFSSLITKGSQNGVWTDVDNSGATGTFPLLDFSGVTPGVYTFSYSLKANSPCQDKQYLVMVEVKDCKCPPVLQKDIPTVLCNDGISIDFNNYFSANVVSALISIPSGQSATILQNNILQLQDIMPGEYTILAALASVPAGCKKDTLLTLQIVDSKNAGTPIKDFVFCEAEDTLLNLNQLLTGADFGGQWLLVPASAALNTLTGTLDINLLSAGSYSLKYIQNNAPPCKVEEALINIVINKVPQADAGEDQQLGCSKAYAVLGGTGNPGLTNVSFEWSNNVPDANAGNPEVTLAGTYFLTVTDLTTGCSSEDAVTITQGTDSDIEAKINLKQPSCSGNSTGSISIEVIKGNPPYLYSINQLPFQPENIFDNLVSGLYTISIEDAAGCTKDTTVEIFSALTGGISLGKDTIINFGDSVFIEPNLKFPVSELASVKWSSLGYISCDTCLNTYLKPFIPTKYFLEVQTKAGCYYKADIIVTVNRDVKYFVPNIFSPNGDGVNDWVEISLGPDIVSMQEFSLFDRWGEQIYKLNNVTNDGIPIKSWDGLFKGSKVNSGVFVYMMKLVLVDGTIEFVTGELTLVK